MEGLAGAECRTGRGVACRQHPADGPEEVSAGLHWHRIANLQDGIICNDTPEGVLEALFSLFERNPDLPAVWSP
ncbi:type VI lipase adapter Tla3 domain-containing protein [Pseudomonas aeruginosa]